MQIFAGVKGRDEVTVDLEVSNDSITRAQVKAIGCLPFLNLINAFKPKLNGLIASLNVPSGVDHSTLILKELILKIKGHWEFPYKEVELCHCRAIPLAKVDAAIIYGAHTVEEVARKTSAGTGCGTCRRDSEKIIKFRLK